MQLVIVLIVVFLGLGALAMTNAQSPTTTTTTTTVTTSSASTSISTSTSTPTTSTTSKASTSTTGGATTSTVTTSKAVTTASTSGGSTATTIATTTTTTIPPFTPLPNPAIGAAPCQITAWNSTYSLQESFTIQQSVPRAFVPGSTWEFTMSYTVFVERALVFDLLVWDGRQWRSMASTMYDAKPDPIAAGQSPPKAETLQTPVVYLNIPNDDNSLQYLTFNSLLRVWTANIANYRSNGSSALWYANCLQYYDTAYQYSIQGDGQFSSVLTYSLQHSGCLLLLNEYIQPYWLVFLIAFISQSVGLALYLVKSCPCSTDEQQETRPRNFFHSAFPKLFLTASLAFQFAHVIYIISTVASEANTAGYVQQLRVWYRYELLFVRILNSGVPLPLISSLLMVSGLWRRVDSDYFEETTVVTTNPQSIVAGTPKSKPKMKAANKKGATKKVFKSGKKKSKKSGAQQKKKESIRMKRLDKKKKGTVSKVGGDKKMKKKKKAKSVPPTTTKTVRRYTRADNLSWSEFVLENYSYPLLILTGLICILLIPFLLTHFFTGLSVYAWVWMMAAGVLTCLSYLFREFGQGERDFLPFIYRILMVSSLSVFLNMLCVYSVLVYSGPAQMSAGDYLNVIDTDSQLRDSLCYIDGIGSNSRATLSFVSFFFN